MRLRNMILAGSLILLTACRREAPPTQAPIESVADFERALENAGVRLERIADDAPEIPHAESQTWLVRGEPIVVYTLDESGSRDQALASLARPETAFGQGRQEIHIWERESFLVVYPGSEGGVVLLISGLLGDASSREVSGPDEPYPPAVSAAQHELSEHLGISAASIDVVAYEPETWPDSCLGLPAGDQVCAQVETPGWRIELDVDGERYLLHSDAVGSQVRLNE